MRSNVGMVVALAGAALAGCADGDKLVDGGPDPIPTDLTVPIAVVESHAQALEQMDFDAYEALMEKPGGFFYAGFRFYIRQDDSDELPWLTGNSWDYDTEADMIRNMMNPEFDGAEVPVETIDVQYEILDEQVLGDRVELAVDATFRVFVSPDDGWIANPQLVFTLASDADGFLRIRSVREMALAPVAEESAVEDSWGLIKARYRSEGVPPPVPEIPVDLTNPQAVIESHALSVRHQVIEAYTALLAPDFEFVIRDDDADDLPWVVGGAWGIEDELRIMSNMMDPDFQGNEDPVWRMDFAYRIIDQRDVGVGMVQVTADADITVLVSADNGWLANTRFEFLLVQDTSGYLRIRTIRERKILSPRSVEESSFGRIKSIYR